MRNYSAKDVDSYIASSGSEAHPTLEELKKLIKSTIPGVEEGIRWGVPFYKYHGVLAGFAAFRNHVSFGFAAVLHIEDRKVLEERGYKTGKKTIQIRFDQKVPTTMIQQILGNESKNKWSQKKHKI
jgi:uncharacterized protein